MKVGEEFMNPYSVESVQEQGKRYFYIYRKKDMAILELPTRYLKYKTRANCSPNTVKRNAFSISYYMYFLNQENCTVQDVFDMNFEKQHRHFTDFLDYLKNGRHLSAERGKLPRNYTCNTYLKDVFGWYQFLAEEEIGDLKVLHNQIVSFTNSVGVRASTVRKRFNGFLLEDEHIGKTIEQENLLILLDACVNIRDQLLLLLLAETGFRIGEVLGIRFTTDIDFKKKLIKVQFRDDNMNGSRAKNAEYRTAKLSNDTFDILNIYLAEQHELLLNTDYLFLVLTGENRGCPLRVNAVYALFRRLEAKTGIKATPHMLRHYFANERRSKAKWDITLISKALGHRQISTTQRYLDIGTEELVNATDEYYKNNRSLFPVDKLL